MSDAALKLKSDIFSYVDYRAYLAEELDQRRQERPSFSLRSFSRICGFSSPNYMSLILSGRRNLISRNIASVVRALRLDPLESRYFRALVEWNQSDAADKVDLFSEVFQIQLKRREKRIHAHESLIFGRWYYSVILELVRLPDFALDPKWIYEKLNRTIPLEEIEKSYELLISIGLLKYEGDRLVHSNQVIATENDQTSLLLQQYHREMLPRAAAAIEANSVEKRNFRAYTMAISKESFEKIKAEIDRFEERVIEIASHEQVPDHVYQLNLQLFHFTQDSRKDPKS